MSQYYTIITDVGTAKIANAISTNTFVNITQIAVGDGNGMEYDPTGAETALKREVWRGAITNRTDDPRNPSWIKISGAVPANVGGFTLREIGLFDDTGALIAIGNYPSTYKPMVGDGATLDLALNTIIAVENTSVINITLDPLVAIASKEYVDDSLLSFGVNVTNPPSPYSPVELNSSVDQSDKINALAEKFTNLFFPSGTYKVNKQLNFVHGQSISTNGKIVFDGTSIQLVNGEGSVVKVSNIGDNYTQLPLPVTDLVKGTLELSFSNTLNVKQGDILCIFDNTEFSWSSDRNYYKKGEFCQVANVSGNVITLTSPIQDSYPVPNSNLGLYKMNMGTFEIIGDLEIYNGLTSPASYGIKFDRVRDFSNSGNIRAVTKGCYAAVCFEQSYNNTFNGTCEQNGDSGASVDYGFASVNSQHIRAVGQFSSSRHGISNTGKDGIASIVNRDCQYTGVVKSTGLTGSPGTCAFDAHANTENIRFSGTIYGGINLAGSSHDITGTVYGNRFGVCVYGNALKAFNHNLSNCKFITDLDPSVSSRGVVDFGNIITFDSDNMLGGTLNLNNIEVIAPNSRFGVIVRTRNTTFRAEEKLDISLVGSSIKLTKGSGRDTIALRVEKTGDAKDIRSLNATGCMFEADRNIIGSTIQAILPTAFT